MWVGDGTCYGLGYAVKAYKLQGLGTSDQLSICKNCMVVHVSYIHVLILCTAGRYLQYITIALSPRLVADNRFFLKVIMSSPCPWASFHPLSPSLSEVRKVRKFYWIWAWNAETQHLMHKVQRNYSSCTCRSSENICSSSSGGAQEKGNRAWCSWSCSRQ